MVLQINPLQTNLTVIWEPLPDAYVLPDHPVENIQLFLGLWNGERLGQTIT